LTKEQLEGLEEAQALKLTVKEWVTLRFADLQGRNGSCVLRRVNRECMSLDLSPCWGVLGVQPVARRSAADRMRPASIREVRARA